MEDLASLGHQHHTLGHHLRELEQRLMIKTPEDEHSLARLLGLA